MDRAQRIRCSRLGWIGGILALTLLAATGQAATTRVTTSLAQGLPTASTICDAMSETPISPGSLSFEECFQGGSTGSGSGTGTFNGEARPVTAYNFFSPQQGLELSLLADSSATVTDDFVGLYEYSSAATSQFLDQITITGGTPGTQGIVQVTLDVEGEIQTTGNAAPGSAFLEITVSSPFASDSLKFLMTPVPGPRVFEVPYLFADDPMDFEIFVEAFAGQIADPALGPFAATQTVDFGSTIRLVSVGIEGTPNGQVISATGFVYPAPLRALVARTGQTATFAAGDDGDLEAGVEWSVPRFTDNGDGTVTDNLTELVRDLAECSFVHRSVEYDGYDGGQRLR